MVYKDYPGINPVLLPSDSPLPEIRLSSLWKEGDTNKKAKGVNSEDLSLTLRLAYSLTAKARHSGGDFYFRSVASAGALYPTELYVATHGVNGLDDGLHHFAIHRHALYPIRIQDLSQYLAGMTETPENRIPTLTFFLTAIFFRSAWKYRERSYRYHLLDTGHLAENLALALRALGHPFNLSYDFDDENANHLLGLDEAKEVALALVQVHGDQSVSNATAQEIDPLPEKIRKASRVAGNEIDYPVIGEMHRAGMSIASEATSGLEMAHELGVTPETWTKKIRPPVWPEIMNYPEAVFHRRSRRNFVKETMGKDCMMALLDSLCDKDGINSSTDRVYNPTLCTGLLVGNAEDMGPGFYLMDTVKGSTGLISAGFFMDKMAHICLDQAWLANAAVHFLFLTNVDVLDRTWGPRGYRHAMMTAGRMGERLYIAATAMGMGCCGIGALYDEEAAGLLGLNKGSKLLYLVAVGPVKSPPGTSKDF
ncbi:MAG: SagB/ThcOx family dehydrogenase [Desulfatiglandales bacterium]